MPIVVERASDAKRERTFVDYRTLFQIFVNSPAPDGVLLFAAERRKALLHDWRDKAGFPARRMVKKSEKTFLVKIVERAMKENDIKSRRALARHLDVSHQTIQYWIDGSTTPENAIMVKLAELAKVDPGSALLRVNRARAKSKKERRVWSNLIKATKGK